MSYVQKTEHGLSAHVKDYVFELTQLALLTEFQLINEHIVKQTKPN